MGWFIFRGKDDPPHARYSMVHSDSARIVPQAPDKDGIETGIVVQPQQPGVVAKKDEIVYFDSYDEAWQECQKRAVAG